MQSGFDTRPRQLPAVELHEVLNAWRRQRIRHYANLHAALSLLTCSTPGGVNGFDTHDSGYHRVYYLEVLNAWRRQRIRHEGKFLYP